MHHTFFTVYFHSVISMYPFHPCQSHLKANAVNQAILLTIAQSHVQAATAENEEQYTMSNKK